MLIQSPVVPQPRFAGIRLAQPDEKPLIGEWLVELDDGYKEVPNTRKPAPGGGTTFLSKRAKLPIFISDTPDNADWTKYHRVSALARNALIEQEQGWGTRILRKFLGNGLCGGPSLDPDHPAAINLDNFLDELYARAKSLRRQQNVETSEPSAESSH